MFAGLGEPCNGLLVDYEGAACPVCDIEFNEVTNRPVLESCGHRMCRACCIKGVDGCEQCIQEEAQRNNLSNCNAQTPVIPLLDLIECENEIQKEITLPLLSVTAGTSETRQTGGESLTEQLSVQDNQPLEPSTTSLKISKVRKSRKAHRKGTSTRRRNVATRPALKKSPRTRTLRSCCPPPQEPAGSNRRGLPKPCYEELDTEISGVSSSSADELDGNDTFNQQTKSIDRQETTVDVPAGLDSAPAWQIAARKLRRCRVLMERIELSALEIYNLENGIPLAPKEIKLCKHMGSSSNSAGRSLKLIKGRKINPAAISATNTTKHRSIAQKVTRDVNVIKIAVPVEEKSDSLARTEVFYECKICGRCFDNLERYKLHAIIHSKERPYVCRYCEKRFRSMESLHIHVVLHTGQCSFRCNKCDEVFGTKWKLDLHLGAHSRTADKLEDPQTVPPSSTFSTETELDYERPESLNFAIHEDLVSRNCNSRCNSADSSIKSSVNTLRTTKAKFVEEPSSANDLMFREMFSSHPASHDCERNRVENRLIPTATPGSDDYVFRKLPGNEVGVYEGPALLLAESANELAGPQTFAGITSRIENRDIDAHGLSDVIGSDTYRNFEKPVRSSFVSESHVNLGGDYASPPLSTGTRRCSSQESDRESISRQSIQSCSITSSWRSVTSFSNADYEGSIAATTISSENLETLNKRSVVEELPGDIIDEPNLHPPEVHQGHEPYLPTPSGPDETSEDCDDDIQIIQDTTDTLNSSKATNPFIASRTSLNHKVQEKPTCRIESIHVEGPKVVLVATKTSGSSTENVEQLLRMLGSAINNVDLSKVSTTKATLTKERTSNTASPDLVLRNSVIVRGPRVKQVVVSRPDILNPFAVPKTNLNIDDSTKNSRN